MQFQDIIQQLAEKKKILTVCIKETADICDIAFIEDMQSVFQDDILYFSYSERVDTTGSLPLNCVLAGLSDNGLPDISNYVIVERNDFFSAFNIIKSILDTHSDQRLFTELTKKADECRDIEAVLDVASVKLDNPLVLCDINFKIIAHSELIPITDPYWIEIIQQGYTPYELIQAFRNMDPSNVGRSDFDIAEVTCSESPHRKFRIHIFCNGNRIGVLLMIASKSAVTPQKLELLAIVRDAINYTIYRYAPYLSVNATNYQQLLYDLLIGANPESLSSQIEQVTFAPKLVAMVAQPTQYWGMQHLKEITSRKLEDYIPGTYVTYLDNTISAVIPLQNTGNITPDTISVLNRFAEEEFLQIGLSNMFSHITSFRKYDQQARRSLQLARLLSHSEIICQYKDYQFYDMLSHIDQQKQLGLYCHPALKQLREYDREHNSTLYHTLRIYLECGCRAKQTAEAMFIHRNSLSYRLNRITELCNLDLEESDTCFALRASYKIDHFLHHDA